MVMAQDDGTVVFEAAEPDDCIEVIALVFEVCQPGQMQLDQAFHLGAGDGNRTRVFSLGTRREPPQ